MISKMYRNSQDQKIFRKSRRFQTSQARDALDWAPCGSAGLGAAPDGRGRNSPWRAALSMLRRREAEGMRLDDVAPRKMWLGEPWEIPLF